jgi:hypothetical protein
MHLLLALRILTYDLGFLTPADLFHHGITAAGTFFSGGFVPRPETAIGIGFAAIILPALFGLESNNRVAA